MVVPMRLARMMRDLELAGCAKVEAVEVVVDMKALGRAARGRYRGQVKRPRERPVLYFSAGRARQGSCGTKRTSLAQTGLDDGAVGRVGLAVMVEVVPTGLRHAVVQIQLAELGPVVQVGLVHDAVPIAVARAVQCIVPI